MNITDTSLLLHISGAITLHSSSLHCLNVFFRVSIKESSVAKLGSVCRRIYRIFSHAYFHHRQIFDKYEVGFLGQRLSSKVPKVLWYNYT